MASVVPPPGMPFAEHEAPSWSSESSELRDSGVPRIGRVPWGTHLCQFYRDRSDLLEILVPYFRAGIAANECCMWITAEPLGVDEARAALAAVVPDLDLRIARGQVEILPHDEWYLFEGRFDMDRVLRGWEERHALALARGYEGLRVTGNTAWLEQGQWHDFTEYEAAIDATIGRLRMMAICTYMLARCGASEVIDVVYNHQLALVNRGGRWEAVESTERRRIADALRESERRMRLLFDHMSSGCAYHQVIYEGERPVDYVFLEANPAFERLTGLRRKELIGRRVTEVIPGIEKGDFDWIGTYGRVASSGEPVRFEQYSSALGRWYSVFAYSPARGQFVAVFDDVTAARLAEEQRRDLVRAVTHDLRTPLSVVSNSVAALRLGASGPAQERAVAAIERSSRRMGSMLADLEEAARLEAGPVRLERCRVEIDDFLSELLRRVEGVIDSARVEVSSPGELPPIDVDPARLERILLNLLSNALKYSPPESRVSIAIERRSRELCIAVGDRGEGIAPDDLPHVFERFFRSRRARKQEGLGLGLHIARTLVEAHGGHIEVDSGPAAGATFRVWLPVAE